jgi:hypothetical protein
VSRQEPIYIVANLMSLWQETSLRNMCLSCSIKRAAESFSCALELDSEAQILMLAHINFLSFVPFGAHGVAAVAAHCFMNMPTFPPLKLTFS